MSKLQYSILKGRITAAKPFGSDPRKRPHYHLLVEAGGAKFDVAVNICSEDPNADDVRVRFAAKVNAPPPPHAAALQDRAEGIVNLPHGSPLGLDYVSDGVVRLDETSLLPIFEPEAEDNGSDAIMDLVDKAVNNPGATVYAFGHRYTQNFHHGHGPSRNPAWGF